MKTSLFALSLILIFIHANSFLYAAAQEPSPVVDIEGNELQTEASYYIRFAGFGFSGVIGLPNGSSEACPAHVIQIHWDTDHPGIPVLVQPVIPTDPILENTTNVNITFTGSVTGCPLGAAYWRLRYELDYGKFFVVAGTLQPDPLSHLRIFQTERSGVYTFGICPPIPLFKCLEIGIGSVLEERRLAVISDTSVAPYLFYFEKAAPQQAAAQVK